MKSSLIKTIKIRKSELEEPFHARARIFEITLSSKSSILVAIHRPYDTTAPKRSWMASEYLSGLAIQKGHSTTIEEALTRASNRLKEAHKLNIDLMFLCERLAIN